MILDALSITIGNHGDSGPVRDVVSYLIGRVAGTGEDLWHTITDATVATFSAVSLPLRKLVIDITPQQSGSGDPSPDNVRPISGWTEANIVVSPTLDAADGTTYPISWQTEAGTVYGGTLDVTTGLLTVTHACINLNILVWSSGDTSTYRHFYDGAGLGNVSIPESGSVVADIISTKYIPASASDIYNANNGYMVAITPLTSSTPGVVRIFDNRYSLTADVSAFESSLTDDDKLFFPLATPQTVQLTPTEVKTLLGQNNVFADTGNINTITFRVR